MSSDRAERRLAAILSADMVGYSRLMEVDEAGTIERQRGHRQDLIDPTIQSFRGRIVKTTGDGMLVEFASAVDAVECAVEIQSRMTEREGGTPEDRRIRYRIGVNVGDIVIDGEDILGDGVNIAARLEALSDQGGLAISGTAHEQVRGKLDIPFEDGGAHEVKNLTRPVHVWRWRPDGVAADNKTAGTTGGADPSLQALLDNIQLPTIAVLPFQNMSRDPDFGYFCDGLTESMITDLSRSTRLAVASRNSSFELKGQSVNAKAAAEKLGVRFLIEGSVQVMGPRMRVNAQLIDARTDNHIWADRYDRQTDDLFAVQDELCDEITVEADIAVSRGAVANVMFDEKTPSEIQRLLRQTGTYIGQLDEDSLLKCQQVADRAMEIDPESPIAMMFASIARTIRVLNGWTIEENALEKALELANRVSSDRPEATLAHLRYAAIGYTQLAMGRFEESLVNCERAVAQAPNIAAVHTIYARTLCALGRFGEARRETIQALKLHPYPYPVVLIILGISTLLDDQFQDAVAAFQAFRRYRLKNVREQALLAAALAAAGRQPEAEEIMAIVLSENPTMNADEVLRPYPFRNTVHYDKLASYLVQAGLRK